MDKITWVHVLFTLSGFLGCLGIVYWRDWLSHKGSDEKAAEIDVYVASAIIELGRIAREHGAGVEKVGRKLPDFTPPNNVIPLRTWRREE